MFYIFSTYFFIEIQRQILNSISYKIAHLFLFDSWPRRSKRFLNTIVKWLDFVATKCHERKMTKLFSWFTILRSRTLWRLTHFPLDTGIHWLDLEELMFKLYHVIVLKFKGRALENSLFKTKLKNESWELRAPPAQWDLRIFLLRACVRGQCTKPKCRTDWVQ